MGKAAGIWKKIKSVAKQIGDGAAKALACDTAEEVLELVKGATK